MWIAESNVLCIFMFGCFMSSPTCSAMLYFFALFHRFFCLLFVFFSIAPNSQIYYPQKKSNTTKVTTQAIKPFSLHLNWNGWRAEIGAFSLSLSCCIENRRLYFLIKSDFSFSKRIEFFEETNTFFNNDWLFINNKRRLHFPRTKKKLAGCI